MESELLVIYRFVCVHVSTFMYYTNTMYAEESPDTIYILGPKAENHNQ